MSQMTRRGFLAAVAATGAARIIPLTAGRPAVRHVVTMVYDKGLGMMRLIDRVVP